MPTKIFLTGGTGYIGGSVLHTLYTTHPEYLITVLLRTTPPSFPTTYPNIRIIQGDYSSHALISSTALASDIVIHNGDSDHEPSLNAILSGLLQRPTPGYLLHLSGSGIVSDWSEELQLGTMNPKIWSDVTSLEDIRSLSPTALHYTTEKILHDTIRTSADKINIAIICPPDLYGKGKGLVKTHSAFIPLFIHEIQKLGGTPFYFNKGTNTRSWAHVEDLMRVYLGVVEAAVSGGKTDDYFNENGYYFAATQEWSQRDVAQATGRILHKLGVIEEPTPVQVGLEQLDGMARVQGYEILGRYLFASNSRTRAERAEGLFGYKGEAPGLLESLEGDILDALKGQ